MSATSQFQTAAKQAYENWQTALAAVATTQAAILNAKTQLATLTATPGGTSYSESGPTGGQSMDWNGQLNALTNTLLMQQRLVNECYTLVCKFPYQSVSRGF